MNATHGSCELDVARAIAAIRAEAKKAGPTPPAPPTLDLFIRARKVIGRAEDAYIAFHKDRFQSEVRRLPIRAFEFFRDEIAAEFAAIRAEAESAQHG